MPDADTALDLSVLEALDYDMPCEHSCHQNPGWAFQHGGTAYYWMGIRHTCSTGVDMYAACKPLGDWFTARADKRITCLTCGHTDYGRDMVAVIGRIKP